MPCPTDPGEVKLHDPHYCGGGVIRFGPAIEWQVEAETRRGENRGK